MGLHKFYHVDRSNSLHEDMTIVLNDKQLSRFGECYWEAIRTKSFEEQTPEQQRESLLEQIKREPAFSGYVSRMQAFFGTNSLDDARRFVDKINPRPPEKIPVFEVFSDRFWSLDMNWLDYAANAEQRHHYAREYWHAPISNHNPDSGERSPPLLEVLMALPVTIGKIVDYI